MNCTYNEHLISGYTYAQAAYTPNKQRVQSLLAAVSAHTHTHKCSLITTPKGALFISHEETTSLEMQHGLKERSESEKKINEVPFNIFLQVEHH